MFVAKHLIDVDVVEANYDETTNTATLRLRVRRDDTTFYITFSALGPTVRVAVEYPDLRHFSRTYYNPLLADLIRKAAAQRAHAEIIEQLKNTVEKLIDTASEEVHVIILE